MSRSATVDSNHLMVQDHLSCRHRSLVISNFVVAKTIAGAVIIANEWGTGEIEDIAKNIYTKLNLTNGDNCDSGLLILYNTNGTIFYQYRGSDTQSRLTVDEMASIRVRKMDYKKYIVLFSRTRCRKRTMVKECATWLQRYIRNLQVVRLTDTR
jgi:hypothetical protein